MAGKMDLRKVALALLLAVCSYAFAGGPGPAPADPIGFAGDTDSGRRPGIIDKVTRALVSIDYDHHELHEGEAFTVSSLSQSLSTGNTFSILISTNGSPEKIHVINELQSTGEGQITFIEGVTVSASGTPITAYNRRRDSTNTCQCSAFVDPTWSGGTTLRDFRCGAGKTVGGSVRAASEWVLKSHTNYVIKYTAQANGIYVELKSDWYEHEDKD